MLIATLKKSLGRKSKDRLLALLYLPRLPRDILFCLAKGLRWTPATRFHGLPRVHQNTRGSIRLGAGITLTSHWRHNSIGVNQAVILKTVRPGAIITIGRSVGISGSTLSAANSILLGDEVLIGSGCLITDSDAHPLDPECRMDGIGTVSKPIVLEDKVFVGARSIILKGVRIGYGSVIGAGSVVTRDVPPFCVAAGNPARVVKKMRGTEKA